MHSYPRNSPQAAARIVVLAMLADGYLSPDELETIRDAGSEEQLGLDRGGIDVAVQVFCEDLLAGSDYAWNDAMRIDSRTLDEFLSEIDCVVLRRKVLRLCIRAIQADGEVSERELALLSAAARQWNLEQDMRAGQAGPQPALRSVVVDLLVSQAPCGLEPEEAWKQ
jgi:hypothetical protein